MMKLVSKSFLGQTARLAWRASLVSPVCAALSFAAPTLASAQEAGSAEADSAIERGREALDQSWFTPPWYDAENDSVKRIAVKPEWDLWEGWDLDLSNWGLPDMSLLEWLAWIVVTLLLAAIAYVLLRAWLQRDRRASQGEASNASAVDDADIARVEALPFQVARRAADFLSEAERCRRAGNYREAIIYLFSHQLVSLDRRQRIRLTKGKTNRQYLRELSRQVALRSLVEETMVTFEDVFFGDHPLDAARFERCWVRLGEFDQLIEQEAA